MPSDPDDEILLEMNRIRGAMEVRAVSAADGLEVVFMAPANAAQRATSKAGAVEAGVCSRKDGRSSGSAEEIRRGRAAGSPNVFSVRPCRGRSSWRTRSGTVWPGATIG